MQSEIDKCVQTSRVIVTLLVFVVLNIWFIFENDPHLLSAFIISMMVFIISFPSSKICNFIIDKGDRIINKIFKILYYAFLLPIIFLLVLVVTALLCVCGVSLIENSLDLKIGIWIAFIGIGIFTCILVPYFQTLMILALRYFRKILKVKK